MGEKSFRAALAVTLSICALVACGDDDTTDPDAGTNLDAGGLDAATADAGTDAATAEDGGPLADGGAPDEGVGDAGPPPDMDEDGVPDDDDNCPAVANEDQADFDEDDIGDACDADRDGDGIGEDGDASGAELDAPCTDGATSDCDDNCPWHANPLQSDLDADGIGDLCDPVLRRSSESLDNTKGIFGLSCDLQAGQQAVGFAYADASGDSPDGFASLCVDRDGSEVREAHADIPDVSVLDPYRCPTDTVPVGVVHRDVPGGDNVDGATLLCAPEATPDATPTPVANADIDGADGRAHLLLCPSGTRFAGVGYKDCPGGCDPAETVLLLCVCTVEGDTSCTEDQDQDGIPDDGDSSFFVDNRCADGVTTGCDDNCPFTANADQADSDGDGRGDACDWTRVESDDALGNSKAWAELICDFEGGEVLRGLVNAERGTYLDGLRPVCELELIGAVREAPTADADGAAGPQLTCDSADFPVGVAFHDLLGGDNLAGATPRCVPRATPGDTPTRVANPDIDMGGVEAEVVTDCGTDEVMVGIAYKDCPGGCDSVETAGALCIPAP